MLTSLFFNGTIKAMLNLLSDMVFLFTAALRKPIDAIFSQRRILKKYCFEARFYTFAQHLDQIIVLNVYDYYTV